MLSPREAMEQRVLCQPEVICYIELLQWAGMFSSICPCDRGAAAVCWRRSCVDCPAAGVIHDGQQPVQCPPLHHSFKGVQLDADDRPSFPDQFIDSAAGVTGPFSFAKHRSIYSSCILL